MSAHETLRTVRDQTANFSEVCRGGPVHLAETTAAADADSFQRRAGARMAEWIIGSSLAHWSLPVPALVPNSGT
jgi:hypothetical protein